jgi:hypothetical protein
VLKIAEALFVETLRRYVDGLPSEESWLASARDPIVEQELRAYAMIRRAMDDWGVGQQGRQLEDSAVRALRTLHRAGRQSPISRIGASSLTLSC